MTGKLSETHSLKATREIFGEPTISIALVYPRPETYLTSDENSGAWERVFFARELPESALFTYGLDSIHEILRIVRVGVVERRGRTFTATQAISEMGEEFTFYLPTDPTRELITVPIEVRTESHVFHFEDMPLPSYIAKQKQEEELTCRRYQKP